MNFRQGNSGKVNPIAQLASHVTQDHARQENIGSQEYVNENSMFPNTFNTTELMGQLQNLDSGTHMVSLFGAMWADFSQLRLTQDNDVQANQQEILPTWNARQDSHTIDLQQNPINQAQAYFPPVEEYLPSLEMINNAYIYNPSRSASSPVTPEKFWRIQKEMAESQNIFDELEEDEQIIEECLETPKIEVKSSSDDEINPNLISYDNIMAADEYGVNDLGIEFNDIEYFYKFVENYVLVFSKRKYEKYRPTSSVALFSLEMTDRGEIKTTRLSHNKTDINVYKMPVKNKENPLEEFTENLLINEQYYDTIQVANNITLNFNDLNDSHNRNSYVFLLTDAYLHEHCFYQACQTLFAWLKNEPSYKDIPVPSFVMENKTETTLDKEQLRYVMKMFITAAQRSRRNPDMRVQIAIAKLCEIDRDYEKSIDCYKCILNQVMDDRQLVYIQMALGNSLALANRPTEAIDIFNRLVDDQKVGFRAQTNIGLIHLYNKNYIFAARHLLYAIYVQMKEYQVSENVSLENSWSRLHLCFNLMCRNDLCEAVNNRDRLEIEKYLFPNK